MPCGQTRLNLPAWLGVGDALSEVGSTAEGKGVLRRMYEQWPFFATNIGRLMCPCFMPLMFGVVSVVVSVAVTDVLVVPIALNNCGPCW